MRFKVFLFSAAVAMSASPPAFASEISDSVVDQLRSFGYSSMTVRHTLLGRIRITAVRDGETREIILNRWSGDVLSDRFIDDEDDGPTRILNYGGGSGSGGSSSGSGSGASSGGSSDHEDEADSEDSSDDESGDETDEQDSDDESDDH